jgi:hypothetical protein
MKRVLTVSIATILLFICGGGLMVSLASMGVHDTISHETAVAYTPMHAEHTTTSSHHCPLMGPGDTLCPMDLFDHLAFVRGLFEVLLPCLLLLLCASSATLLWPVATTLVRRRDVDSYNLTWRWRRRLLTTFSYRQYQDYFATGLLNPKYF